MNCVEYYDVKIRHYSRMSIACKNLEIPLKTWNKDALEVLDPLYNRDMIYERPIMNAKIG